MAAESITCPYCNSYVDAPAAGTTRVLCPRCGERFPYHGTTAAPPAPASAAPDPDVPMPARFSNRAIVLAILGVMLTMALVGLMLSLETVSFRRENDRHISKDQVIGIPLVIKAAAAAWMAGLVLVVAGVAQRREPGIGEGSRKRWLLSGGLALAVVGVVLVIFSGPLRRRSTQLPADSMANLPRTLAPAQLEALGYLPPDTNIVAGVHVADLLDSPENRALLDSVKIGTFDLSAERVQRLTGLRRQDIDYVLVGLKIEDEILPRITVIVRTRARFDPEAVRTALHGVPSAQARRENRFQFKLDRPALDAEAWLLPEQRLLVFGLTRADLEAVAAPPREGLKHLAPRLREMLELRLAPDARIWVAGSVDHWERTWFSKTPNAALVQKVRSFGVGVIPGLAAAPSPRLRADVNCVDAEAARAVARYVAEHRPESVELVLPEPQGEWVGLKAQLKPEDVSRLLAPRSQ